MKRTRIVNCMLVALLVSALLTFLFLVGFYSNIQLKLADSLYGGGQPLNNIVIVAIDDHSLQEIGRWPWDRREYITLLDRLEQSKVVAFDVAFFEESDRVSDIRFAEAVAGAGNVVMPVEYTRFETVDRLVHGREMMQPIDTLKEVAAGFGYINVITDNDGVTRAANTNIQGEFDHFTHAILEQYMRKPVEKETRALINFVGNPGTFQTYSFFDVAEARHSPEEFEDKIVLIGATAPDLHDDYFVPTSGGKAMPGVEVHANLLQQMITGKDLTVAPRWVSILTIILIAIGIALLVHSLPIWASAIMSVITFFAYAFVAIFAFNSGWILNIVYVPVTIITTYIGTMVYFYISERKRRREVQGAFGKYVSKDVIQHILENPDKLKLGGQKRMITVFFSDIRGFTTISEKLSPEQLVHLLNEYLTEMTNIILRTNGVVDKYMGDAIMAFWNAPLNQPKHAESACTACLMMERRLKQLQKKWNSEGVPPLEIGIGLNTGPAVVGNMGSYERFDYTAMGDTVNLGSRLEGLNKPYGTRILISESTRDRIKNRPYLVRKLDMVRVKGKNEPITIYELLCKKDRAKPALLSAARHFEKGLGLYFKQQWNPAIADFKKADSLRNEGDAPSKVFIERCRHFSKNSPGKKWDGVWVMKTK
ncbi:CHASE2 domain-containing protein [Nanoarchaeota archaeon]